MTGAEAWTMLIRPRILSKRPPATLVSGRPIHTLGSLSICIFLRHKMRSCKSATSQTWRRRLSPFKKRKDHLLEDSYKWILDNQEYKDFTDWHHGNTKRLLWIKGDPGKGKTMLLIGVIREFTAQLETHFDKPHLSYFFCQGTDDRLNTATAI